jgi:hypothetical protein
VDLCHCCRHLCRPVWGYRAVTASAPVEMVSATEMQRNILGPRQGSLTERNELACPHLRNHSNMYSAIRDKGGCTGEKGVVKDGKISSVHWDRRRQK